MIDIVRDIDIKKNVTRRGVNNRFVTFFLFIIMHRDVRYLLRSAIPSLITLPLYFLEETDYSP